MAKVMLIDDDVESTAIMAAALTKGGHEVTVRDTCEKGVEAIIENKPDVVVLDVMFPDNSTAGFELAREIRQTASLAALPVILLTNVNQQLPVKFSGDDIDPAWMPVLAFLEKPCNAVKLLAKIDEVLKAAPG